MYPETKVISELVACNCVTQQTQNTCVTFIQRRPNAFDVGTTLYKCFTNVLRLLERP